MPELLGGSADLTGSNLTAAKASRRLDSSGGNYVHYGVREFGMAAIMNGVALHGGFIPYGGTFAVFSDYARSGIRMSALMKQRVVYVLTHDSIGLGEDGPTHQPVEHAAALRVIPNLDVWRPCDGIETAVAWRCALERSDGPTALLLSRQNLPQVARDDETIAGIAKGGYVLSDAANRDPGCGDHRDRFRGGTRARSAPAPRRARYRGAGGLHAVDCTLRCAVARVPAQRAAAGGARIAVEAAHPDYWRKYVGLDGAVIGMPGFGESAPAGDLYEHFGLTANAIATAAAALCATEEPLAA